MNTITVPFTFESDFTVIPERGTTATHPYWEVRRTCAGRVWTPRCWIEGETENGFVWLTKPSVGFGVGSERGENDFLYTLPVTGIRDGPIRPETGFESSNSYLRSSFSKTGPPF